MKFSFLERIVTKQVLPHLYIVFIDYGFSKNVLNIECLETYLRQGCQLSTNVSHNSRI